MKVGVAQTRAVPGDVAANIQNHLQLLALATARGADLVLFPELSLTGYEPALARALATTADDPRLDVFQAASDIHRLTIGVGAPVRGQDGVGISLVLFRPHQPRTTYQKRFLHPDETPYFVSGPPSAGLWVGDTHAALAICHELFVPAHATQAISGETGLYLASVAKSGSGVARAGRRLADIARQYGLPTLMANCVGPSDDFVAAGQSAAWDPTGRRVAQLNDAGEGLLLFDTGTRNPVIVAG